MEEKVSPFEADEQDKPKTASRFNGKLLRGLALIGFIFISVALMVWAMFSQNKQDEQRKQALQKAQEKPVHIDAKRAKEEALQRAKRAQEKKAEQAKKEQEAKKALLNKQFAPKPTVAPQPTLQPTLQPTGPAMQQPVKVNHWKQAREAHNQQKAQQFYQMRAQALMAPMRVFGPSGFGRKAQQKPTEPVSEEQAFLNKLNAIKASKTTAMYQPTKAPQASQPVVHPNKQFFGQPLGAKPVMFVGDKVATGTIVSVVLETGINSQLPGMILGVVAAPVYDPTMTKIVIPSGSRLVGQYNNRVEPGQTRAQLRWSRLVLPTGRVIALPNLPGVDFAGFSGVEGQVDEHWGRIALGAVISATFSSAAAVFGGPTNQLNVQPRQQALYGAFEPFQATGQAIAKRFLSVEPTLTIQAGALVGMLVTQDLVIPTQQEVRQ